MPSSTRAVRQNQSSFASVCRTMPFSHTHCAPVAWRRATAPASFRPPQQQSVRLCRVEGWHGQRAQMRLARPAGPRLRAGARRGDPQRQALQRHPLCKAKPQKALQRLCHGLASRRQRVLLGRPALPTSQGQTPVGRRPHEQHQGQRNGCTQSLQGGPSMKQQPSPCLDQAVGLEMDYSMGVYCQNISMMKERQKTDRERPLDETECKALSSVSGQVN